MTKSHGAGDQASAQRRSAREPWRRGLNARKRIRSGTPAVIDLLAVLGAPWPPRSISGSRGGQPRALVNSSRERPVAHAAGCGEDEDEESETSEATSYVLGSGDTEIARLDAQASAIAGATEALLRAAGIGGAMRVLDLGTGLGHVAFQLAQLLDPGGSVLGVDQAERLLEIAERRRVAARADNVRFLQADARTFSPHEPFDAVVARLLLFHLSDRDEVLRRQLHALHPGGRMVLIEFDNGAMRGEPEVPLIEAVRGWIEAAFRSAAADPRIGARAGQLLRQAGFVDVSTFGIQAYFAPSDPTGPMLCAGVARSLAAQIVAQGIAREAELGLETLEERIAEQVAARDAIVVAPTVVGAWGTRPPDGSLSSDPAAQSDSVAVKKP